MRDAVEADEGEGFDFYDWQDDRDRLLALAGGQRLLRGPRRRAPQPVDAAAAGRDRTVAGGPDATSSRPGRARSWRSPASTCPTRSAASSSAAWVDVPVDGLLREEFDDAAAAVAGRAGLPAGRRSTWTMTTAGAGRDADEDRHHRDHARQQEHRARRRVHRQRGADRRRPRQGDQDGGREPPRVDFARRRAGGRARGVPSERVSAGAGHRRRRADRRHSRGVADPDRRRAALPCRAPCARRRRRGGRRRSEAAGPAKARCSPIAWWPTPCASSNGSSAAPAIAARA